MKSRKISAAATAFSILLLLCGILATPAAAQEWDLSGYLKTLFIGSRTFFDEDFSLATHRLRTQLVFRPISAVEILAALDNQLRWGGYLGTEQHALARPLEERYYVDMTLTPYDNTAAQWRAEFYRLYLRASGEAADLCIGRQRIAWGTGRLWNPTDLFNPVSPLAIEPAEKRGADAVAVALRPSADVRLELAAAVGADRDDVRWGARGGTTVGSYDVSLMAGRFRDSDVIGLDFSGYLGDAGFRGEFTHTWDPERRYLRGVLSFEYTFPPGIDLLCEYLYNGGNIGEITPEALDSLAIFDAITTLNRHFLAARVGGSASPLLTVGLMGIVELEDGGLFLSPTLTYSWKQDLDVTIGAQLFFGDSGDFALGNHAVVLAAEWYF